MGEIVKCVMRTFQCLSTHFKYMSVSVANFLGLSCTEYLFECLIKIYMLSLSFEVTFDTPLDEPSFKLRQFHGSIIISIAQHNLQRNIHAHRLI